MAQFTRLLRAAALTAVTLAAVWATWHLTAGATTELAHDALGPRAVLDEWTLDRLVVGLGSGLLMVAMAGLAVMVGLSVTAMLAAERQPTLAATCRRLTPPRCRRLVAVLLGLGVAAPITLSTGAVAGEHRPICGVVCPAQPRRVVVRPGDSLWLIAARRCGEGAGDAEIAVLTQQLYALNRAKVGADSDLIFPGLILRAPEGRP